MCGFGVDAALVTDMYLSRVSDEAAVFISMVLSDVALCVGYGVGPSSCLPYGQVLAYG